MTLVVPQQLLERAAETGSRLGATAGSMRALGLVDVRHPWITIYATGSMGRHEIGGASDLDVFIVDAADGTEREPRLTQLQTYRLIADLIRAAEGAGFPPFSRDGDFLAVHRLAHLVDRLGKPDEDHLNVFTARMLLLLESECLMGHTAYDRCVDRVLDRYWAEDDEIHDFRPTMLINDIVRYWKTLCLSYEGWRTDLGRGLQPDDRISLLKLKYNRVWLCFNSLAYLLLGDAHGTFTRDHAKRLVRLTPVQRLEEIVDRTANEGAGIAELAASLLEGYAWWLERTAPPRPEVHAWAGDDEAYRDASARAKAFGDGMWELVSLLGDRVGLTRYLLV